MPCCRGRCTLLPGKVRPATGDSVPRPTAERRATGEGVPRYRGQCAQAHCQAQGYRGRCARLPGTVRPGAVLSPGLPGKVCPATGDSAPRRTAERRATGEGVPRYRGRCAQAHCPAQGYRGRCAPLPGTVRPGALPSPGLPGKVCPATGTSAPGALPRTMLPGTAAPAPCHVLCHRGLFPPARCRVGCCRRQSGPAHCHARCSPAHVSGLQACISANPPLVGQSPTQSADPSLSLTSVIWADVGCLMVDELIPSGLLQYYWVRSTICPASIRLAWSMSSSSSSLYIAMSWPRDIGSSCLQRMGS